MRIEGGCFVGSSETIPGAHVLADIAAKHPILELPLNFGRNGFFQLNGKIGNALTAVNHVGANDGIGRAGVDATRTGAAIVRYWAIGFQFKVENQLANEEKTNPSPD